MILDKIISIFKSVFGKNTVKKLDVPKQEETIVQEDAYRNEFLNSLKENTSKNKKKQRKIETLVCFGDGLGFKKDVSA